jgi:peptide subunit release factor 1 (eRF1)
MLTRIDLDKLSEISTNEKTCLSLYLSGPKSIQNLEATFTEIRSVLKKGEAERDEKEHFEENINMVKKFLKKNPLTEGSLCIFSCWILDFFQAYNVAVPVSDLVWFDSSPYIRPLAELQEEYESVAVVIADNRKARIFLITLAVSQHESTILGDIKNHVRKGGWSQQRYERRRDKELLHYSREIVEALENLEKSENFRRILLVGGKEILNIIYDTLPKRLQIKVKQKAMDLHKRKNIVNKEVMDLFFEQERQSEYDLWEKIRSEYLRAGLGIVGIHHVLKAVRSGQVDQIIVNRDYQESGIRCRDCNHLEIGDANSCSNCGSTSVFTVDCLNEVVELAKQTGAEVDFCDTIEPLKKVGDIAALLRYKN